MIAIENTTFLAGKSGVPSSKSHSIRAIFFSLLSSGTSTLYNVLRATDTEDALRVCQELGAQIDWQGNGCTIQSVGVPLCCSSQAIYTGNSGLTTQFVLPILGLRERYWEPIRVECGDQMRARPVQPLVGALRELGLSIIHWGNPEQFPLSVSGQLRSGTIRIDGTTSQYLSALLMALPCVSGESHIRVQSLQERPYIEMTCSWLRAQGIEYQQNRALEQDVFSIKGNQRYSVVERVIPGDFSSASCLIAAAVLLPGEVTLTHLEMDDTQGDKQLIFILQQMGADIRIESGGVVIRGGKPLTGRTIEAYDVPDLVPILAVIGTQAQGRTQITRIGHARLKETDRIHAISEGLRRLGARVETEAEGITVYPSDLKGGLVEGYGDHRTVMAFSVAGLLAEGVTLISGHEVVHKTYPDFFDTLRSLGARVCE